MLAFSRKQTQAPTQPARPDCYSEKYLDRKIRAGRAHANRYSSWLAPQGSQAAAILRTHELDDLIARANLTQRQRQVVQLMREGLSEREMAQAIGCSRSYAHQVRLAALAKLKAAAECYEFAGIYEIYTSEVRRKGRPAIP